MSITRIKLEDKSQTGEAMYDLCFNFKDDLHLIYLRKRNGTVPLSDLSLEEYYNYVREIPYKQDTKPVEVIGRPLRLVKLPKLDCKKKAVLMGSYAALNKIPFQFVAVSSRIDKRIHHVFPELLLNRKWVSFDGTYKHYYIGMKKPYTAREIL